MTEVVILGAGNVATHLFKAFMASKAITVKQVYNHQPESLDFFKKQVPTTTNIQEIKNADFIFLAVKDDVIEEICSRLQDKDAMLLHTSGAKSMNALSFFQNYGVFYPLQSFTRDKSVDFWQVPVCLEANTPSNLKKLKKFASLVSHNCYEMNSQKRKALHVAAVFVNNFSNYMYSLGAEICEAQQLPFDILKPLIKETASKIEVLPPDMAQTGPAIREDRETINAHLKMLNPEQQKVYKLLTQSIQDFHGKKL